MDAPSRSWIPRTPRLGTWDYRTPGIYFVTLNTKRRHRILSRVEYGEVLLSPLGCLVNTCWHEIPEHLPGVELGRFVVMPDHLHGILVLPRVGRSLSAVIGQFKAAVTRVASRDGVAFDPPLWQRSFYERILRTPREWWYHDRYILENPARWRD